MSTASEKLKANLTVKGKEVKTKTKVSGTNIKDKDVLLVAIQIGKDLGYII